MLWKQLWPVILIWTFFEISNLAGAVLFESGILGPTQVAWQDGLNGLVKESSVQDTVFSGVKFELKQSVVTTEIGGHFFAETSGNFFGAIISLDDQTDFPDSQDFSSADVLGHILLTFPLSSKEVFGDLELSLTPGWYALVFGSGYFGATGDGGMVLNNPDINSPTYIAWQQGTGWFDLSDLSDVEVFKNYRFVVLGNVVPEPTSIALVLLISCSWSQRPGSRIYFRI